MKYNILIITFLIGILNSVSAQEKNHFEIELDPIVYALGGISANIAYTIKNHRIQLGYAQVTLPEAAQSIEGITESTQGFPLIKWDIFFGKEDASHGFFAGPSMNYFFATYKTVTDETKAEGLYLGIRAGYKFDLFKNNKFLNGLYLTPWVGVSYGLNSSDIELDNQEHSIQAWGILPTVHLGWTF
jgi:hypothetical protein